MMAGRFSFSNFFGVGDDQFDDPEQTAQAAPQAQTTQTSNNRTVPKIETMQGVNSENSIILLFVPIS